MTNYHLRQRGHQWELTREDHGSPLAHFENKEDALKDCTLMVSQKTGSLKIHRADGIIEEERTFQQSILLRVPAAG